MDEGEQIDWVARAVAAETELRVNKQNLAMYKKAVTWLLGILIPVATTLIGKTELGAAILEKFK